MADGLGGCQDYSLNSYIQDTRDQSNYTVTSDAYVDNQFEVQFERIFINVSRNNNNKT